MFNNELELGKFFSSMDIIPDAYRAILETTLAYELHTKPSGINILAFNHPSVDYTTRFLNGEFELVSSENLKVIDFIQTKHNTIFSINKAAIEMFEQLSDDLKVLENKHLNSSLVITGSGLGGYLAILSAIRLQKHIDDEETNGAKNTKRPICITFGSPLIGDIALQNAISERPQWKSSFLNVVAKKDPMASFFSSSSMYKPLCTYLFGDEFGCLAAFQDQESVLVVLDAMEQTNAGKTEVYDYGNVLGSIRKKILYRAVSEFGEFDKNPLKAGITLQLKEVGMLSDISNDISNDLIREMTEKREKIITSSRNVYEPAKKLTDIKICLTFMEWYMKTQKSKGGYYDSFKNAMSNDEIKIKNEFVTRQRKQNKYWEKLVTESNLLPQKDGAKLRKRWLLTGNNYRRIVEPLDIAEYYKNGNKNYIKEYRPERYKLLEKWLSEYNQDLKPSDEKKNKAASLTEDSCFWAHVEEALILLNDTRNGEFGNNAADIERELKMFEEKVMSEINGYMVSPDVFVSGSSFMTWWDRYKAYKGSSYASEFTKYMNNKSYKSYQ